MGNEEKADAAWKEAKKRGLLDEYEDESDKESKILKEELEALRALERDEKDPSAWAALARAYEKRGEEEEAAAAWEKAFHFGYSEDNEE